MLAETQRTRNTVHWQHCDGSGRNVRFRQCVRRNPGSRAGRISSRPPILPVGVGNAPSLHNTENRRWSSQSLAIDFAFRIAKSSARSCFSLQRDLSMQSQRERSSLSRYGPSGRTFCKGRWSGDGRGSGRLNSAPLSGSTWWRVER